MSLPPKSTDFEIYVVTDMSKPPINISATPSSTIFTHPLEYPFPDEIVVFCIVYWSDYTADTHVNVEVVCNSGTHKLGKLTNEQRCIYWEKKKYGRRVELDLIPKAKAAFSLVLTIFGSKRDVVDSNLLSTLSHLPPNVPTFNPAIDHGHTKSALVSADFAVNQKSPVLQRKKYFSCFDRSDKENAIQLKLRATRTKTPTQSNIVNVSGTWKDISCKDQSMPSSRWGHTLTQVSENRALLIGGQGERSGLCRDAIWLLNTETRKWNSVATSKESVRPEYRIGHSATFHPLMRCIYVFGGIKQSKWLQDIHMLDLDTWAWITLRGTNKSPTCAYHSANLVNKQLWIFGGTSAHSEQRRETNSNTLHIFCLATCTWTQAATKGKKPQPRSGHSSTLFDKELVVFGGWDFPICFDEIFVLDTETLEWKQPVTFGPPPKPRSWHSAAALRGHQLLIHAGYDGDLALNDTFIFDIDTCTWSEVKISSAPSPRAGHAIVRLPYSYNRGNEEELIVFAGGDNNGNYFKDVFSLSIVSPVLKRKLSATSHSKKEPPKIKFKNITNIL